MEKRIIYVAYDGKVFESEEKCIEYEEIKKRVVREAIQKTMLDLDAAIWKKYYPNNKNVECPKLHIAGTWLRNDIVTILSDENNDLEKTLKDIWAMIRATKYHSEILTEYVRTEEVLAEVKIRRDFKAAFDNVKYGSDLAHEVGYTLSEYDLKKLALLHKSNKCRKKIESLLTACNYHGDCSKFRKKEYEDFLEV